MPAAPVITNQPNNSYDKDGTIELSGTAEGIVHPALLTTLVYRFGIPGHVTRRVAEVQANGQCALYRCEPLECSGGLAAARAGRAPARAGSCRRFQWPINLLIPPIAPPR